MGSELLYCKYWWKKRSLLNSWLLVIIIRQTCFCAFRLLGYWVWNTCLNEEYHSCWWSLTSDNWRRCFYCICSLFHSWPLVVVLRVTDNPNIRVRLHWSWIRKGVYFAQQWNIIVNFHREFPTHLVQLLESNCHRSIIVKSSDFQQL